MVKFHALIY